MWNLVKQYWVWLCCAVLAIAVVITSLSVAFSKRENEDIPTAGTTNTTMTTLVTTVPSTTSTLPTTVTTTNTFTTTKRTTRRTTHRTVAPPPIVVEPDNVTDDTVEKPDESVTKPTTPNGVTIEHVRDHFGGKGNLIGIDVARHQGDIDWKKVKAAGIQFAIIRCGYRTTVSGEVYKDAHFETNIQGAIEAGIPVGIYFFSAAKTETEVLEEAAFVIEVLKPYKEHISWPVAYDFEIFDYDRLKGVDYTTVTNNAMTFMDVVAAEGYTPMLYSSRNMLRDRFETARLSAYRVWMAQYVNTLDQKKYTGDHVMWQCASDGRVDGIEGDVDLNIAYRDLSTVVSPLLPAPDPGTFPLEFEGFTFKTVCDEVKVKKAVGLRIAPFAETPNIWLTAKKDATLIRTGIDEKNGWSRVEVDGVILYVKTDALAFIRTTVTTTTTTTAAPTTTTTVETTTQTETTTTTDAQEGDG